MAVIVEKDAIFVMFWSLWLKWFLDDERKSEIDAKKLTSLDWKINIVFVKRTLLDWVIANSLKVKLLDRGKYTVHSFWIYLIIPSISWINNICILGFRIDRDICWLNIFNKSYNKMIIWANIRQEFKNWKINIKEL